MSLRKYGTFCPKDDAAKLLRRGVVLLAALLLVCTLMAGAVSAETTTVNDFQGLQSAFQNGNEIKLTADILTVPVNTLIVSDDVTLTLDLNGHTLGNTTFASEKDTDGNIQKILSVTGGSLTLKDSGSTGKLLSNWTAIHVTKGTLDLQGGFYSGYHASALSEDNYGYTIVIQGSESNTASDYSKVTIGKNAVVEGYSYAVQISQAGSSSSYGVVLDVYGTLKGNETAANMGGHYGGVGITVNGNIKETTGNIPKITIHDGAVLQGFHGGNTDTGDADGPAIYAAGHAEWIINGGTFSGDEALGIKDGKWIINGGTFTANGAYYRPATAHSSGSEQTGAAISVTNTYERTVTIEITGGTFTSTQGIAFYDGLTGGEGKSSGLTSLKITGGTFTSAANKEVIVLDDTPENKEVSLTGGTFIVNSREGLKNALELGGSGYTVKLGEGITYGEYNKTSRIDLTKAGTLTLDLNGKTITAQPTPKTDTNFGSSFIKINEGVTLTVKDSASSGTITVNDASTSISDLSNKPYIFFVAKEGVLNLASGTFASPAGYVIGGNGDKTSSTGGTYASPEITITGGTLTAGQTAIYMPAYGGKLTITDGTVTGTTGGIDIRTGTITITGGTIASTGNNVAAPTAVTGHPLCDGSAIVLESSSAYETNIVLKISGDAVIKSTNGAALRNLVRSGDVISGKTASVTVTIEGSAKLEGKTAAIENARYTGDTDTSIVGTFNLNGGSYKGDEILKEIDSSAVHYPSGYSMTKQADESGYHFVTKVVEPTISEKVETKEDGKTTISAAPGDTLDYNEASKTVTMKDETSGVKLEVIYGNDAQKTGETVSGTVNSITATYEDVDLDGGHAVSLEIALDGDNPAEITAQLPSIIKSVKVDIVKTSLSADYNNVQILTMFEALSSDLGKFNDAIKDKGIVITFKIPATAVGSNPVFSIAHFTANGDIKGILNPDSVVKDGDYWIIKVTATEFSGYAPFTGTAKSSGYSSSGNTNNAFRVLFDTSGGSYVSPATGLSYGDKISQPANPVKDGYTFGGWYKDAACTQAWSFSDSIPGDMTLYAKWTS
ncbi:InlB B-repeat-containing protein, partial [Methanocorpusculum sp. MG]